MYDLKEVFKALPRVKTVWVTKDGNFHLHPNNGGEQVDREELNASELDVKEPEQEVDEPAQPDAPSEEPEQEVDEPAQPDAPSEEPEQEVDEPAQPGKTQTRPRGRQKRK